MPLQWTGLDAMIGKCNLIASGAGLRKATPLIENGAHERYVGMHRWQNRTNALEDTSDTKGTMNGYQILVVLFVVQYYGQWVEGGSRYLGFPSRYMSIMPALYSYLPEAMMIAAQLFLNP